MTRAIRKHLGDFVALAVLITISIGVAAYIISQQESRGYFPLIEKPPFNLKAEFSDAQAVIPGQGQTVRVAGVEVGKITGVEPKNGVAVVTMALNRDMIDNHKLQVLSDATAQLRPRTGLKDMFIELDPGTAGTKLKENGTIPVQNTEPDIDPDEFLSALDTDTRSYLQLLINGLGKGFAGHGKDLNAIFKALGPTQHDLARISSAIASRRHQLARLVHNYADLTNTLATRDSDIHRLVISSNAVLSAFAQENQNISLAVSKLPGTLGQTSQTLAKVNTLSQVLQPALQSLRPAFRELDVANHAVLPFVKEAAPITKNQIRPFVRYARPYIRILKPAVHNLRIATPDLSKSLFELNRFFNMAAFNTGGRQPVPSGTSGAKAYDEGYLYWVAWVSHNTASLFNTSDARGPFRRTLFGTSCELLAQQLAANPAAGPLFGLTDLITAPTGICHHSSGSPKVVSGSSTNKGNAGGTGGNGTSSNPSIPNLPQVPSVPGLPPLPGLPGIPKLPGLAVGGGGR